jgi:hypothetical protein
LPALLLKKIKSIKRFKGALKAFKQGMRLLTVSQCERARLTSGLAERFGVRVGAGEQARECLNIRVTLNRTLKLSLLGFEPSLKAQRGSASRYLFMGVRGQLAQGMSRCDG